MENIIQTLLQNYGIYGILVILVAVLGYLIWGDRKNNWGCKIDKLDGKMDNLDSKIDIVKDKLNVRIDGVEEKIGSIQGDIQTSNENEKKQVGIKTINIMETGFGGQLSKILKQYCSKIGCDHIYMGSFHNGTADIRGIHYCKFDILLDEFRDPLHLNNNDIDFQPLYKDENIVAYGDLPYKITHIDSVVIPVEDDDNTLLNLSDTLYRRCKSRDITYIGFSIVHDDNGMPVGFIGCVSYTDEKPSKTKLLLCVHEIEELYKQLNKEYE